MNSALALALLSQVSAFGLVTIHSGSEYQYSPVKLASNGRLSLNGETDADFTLTDGKLSVNGESIDMTGGRLIAGQTYSSVFGQDGNDLTYNSQNSWVICIDQNEEIAFAGQGTPSDCTNTIGVALYIAEGSGSSSSSSSAESSAASTSSTETSTEASTEAATSTETSSVAATTSASDAATTDVVEQTVTETVCTKSSCTAVASANGAAKNGFFVGAVGAVAAALL